jgi:RNA polymerase sigma factor (sigma-70 family)
VLPASAGSTAELVGVVRRGGADAAAAWDELIERHKRVVWKAIRNFDLRDDERWDAFQATWLRLLERLDQVRDPERLAGWLATTATNEVRTLLRRTSRISPSDSLPEAAGTDSGPGERLERDELAAAVRAGFERLPERCRCLLRLLTADPPLSYRTIEELLDMPHGSIGPTRRRCLENLRRTPDLAPFLPVAASGGPGRAEV